MWDITDKFRVRLGGNYYIDCGSLISVGNEPLFTLKRRDDGQLGIDFDIYDSTGKKVATVRGGRIVSGNKADYEFHEAVDHFWIKDQSGRTICDIKRKAKSPMAEIEVSVDLFTKTGFRLTASPEATNIGTNLFVGNVFCGLKVAIQLS